MHWLKLESTNSFSIIIITTALYVYCTLLPLHVLLLLSGRRIRNRWLVAYTLVRNPSLIPVRKLHLINNIIKSDIDDDEKVALKSVKVNLHNVDVEQDLEKDTGTN